MEKSLKTDFKISSERPPSHYLGKKDMEIWDHFRNGDDGAFVFIYHSYIEKLYNIGGQMTANIELVKDCLHDFFLDLRSRKDHLGPTDNIKLYLFKSFRRRIVHQLKKENKYNHPKHIEYPVEFSIETRIINAQISEEKLKNLKHAISKLKRKEREIVFFFFYENMSYQEIAEILEYEHVASARRFVYNILKKLKKFMPILIILGQSEY